jgi:hypothetical protein
MAFCSVDIVGLAFIRVVIDLGSAAGSSVNVVGVPTWVSPDLYKGGKSQNLHVQSNPRPGFLWGAKNLLRKMDLLASLGSSW